MNGGWGSRSCEPQNDAVRNCDTLFAALNHCYDTLIDTCIQMWLNGEMSDEDLVPSLKKHKANYEQQRKALISTQMYLNQNI